ncbi:MAG TPA: hypothetical protein VFK19_10120 [Sphingomicrobium sp.]|nr:hypothetical protein [Sphingomicrobium sp.]
MHRAIATILYGATLFAPAAAAAQQAGAPAVECVDNSAPVTRTPTMEMLVWMTSYSNGWNPADAFSVGGVGALDRLFDSSGRAVHPKELAAIIAASPSFAGKKKIDLGVSDSDSYAKQLGALLKVQTVGCAGDTYYLKDGEMMCGEKPVYSGAPDRDIGRSAPSGFTVAGAARTFCSKENQSVSPSSMLSAAMEFGMFKDEVSALTAKAATDKDAAFRLYQYYWISKRDRTEAMKWLNKAAELGNDVARYNLAYEDLEAGDTEKGNALMAALIAKKFSAPDLRKYYGK